MVYNMWRLTVASLQKAGVCITCISGSIPLHRGYFVFYSHVKEVKYITVIGRSILVPMAQSKARSLPVSVVSTSRSKRGYSAQQEFLH